MAPSNSNGPPFSGHAESQRELEARVGILEALAEHRP